VEYKEGACEHDHGGRRILRKGDLSNREGTSWVNLKRGNAGSKNKGNAGSPKDGTYIRSREKWWPEERHAGPFLTHSRRRQIWGQRGGVKNNKGALSV